MENKVDAHALMNDQMKAVLAKSAELAGSDAFATDAGFEGMRENYTKERKFWNEGGPVMAKTVDEMFDGPMGEFKVRFYYPVEAEKLPAIVFIHGGGFVVGNPDTHDRVCRILAEKTGAAVVSVDYHLSPESEVPHQHQGVRARCQVSARARRGEGHRRRGHFFRRRFRRSGSFHGHESVAAR